MICYDTPPMDGWMGGSIGRVMSNHQISNKYWLNPDNSILFADWWSMDISPCTHHPLESILSNWNYKYHSVSVWLCDN